MLINLFSCALLVGGQGCRVYASVVFNQVWLYKPLVCSKPVRSVRVCYSPQVIPLPPGHWLFTLWAWEPLEHKQRPNFASCLRSSSPSSQSDPFVLSTAFCHVENGPQLLLDLIMLRDGMMWGRFYIFFFSFSMHQMFCFYPHDNTVISKGGKLLLRYPEFENSPLFYIHFVAVTAAQHYS